MIATTQTNLGPISKGRKVWQSFTSTKNGLHAISLYVATYRQQIDSDAILSIWDGQRKHRIRETRINTREFHDNTWGMIHFEPIWDSQDHAYWFCFETNGRKNHSVTLWTNNKGSNSCEVDRRTRTETVCYQCHYLENSAYYLDGRLFRGQAAAPEISLQAQEELQKILISCVYHRSFYFLRLAHLLDAFGRTHDAQRVLSIGCGEAFQEAFLAGRKPNLEVMATDIYQGWNTYPFNNLHFGKQDITLWQEETDYDFVFSIECLEHIQDYRLAFRNMARKIRPGKYLYISVPFASKEEQQDEALCKQEYERHGHWLPGFSFDDLEGLFQENHLQVLHATSMFRTGIADNINELLGRMNQVSIESGLKQIVGLFLLDIQEHHAQNRSEAVGIRFLGQKRN